MFNDIRVVAALRTLALLVSIVASIAVGAFLIVNISIWFGPMSFAYLALAVMMAIAIFSMYEIMLFKVKQEREFQELSKQINSKV